MSDRLRAATTLALLLAFCAACAPTETTKTTPSPTPSPSPTPEIKDEEFDAEVVGEVPEDRAAARQAVRDYFKGRKQSSVKGVALRSITGNIYIAWVDGDEGMDHPVVVQRYATEGGETYWRVSAWDERIHSPLLVPVTPPSSDK